MKSTMKRLVYDGPGKIDLKEIPIPVILKPTDSVVLQITTPMLLKTVTSGKLEPSKLITHRFKMKQQNENS